MLWVVSAPFFHDKHQRWLIPFINGDHEFVTIVSNYVHDRSREKTSIAQWFDYLCHGIKTFQFAKSVEKSAGVITIFPQLAIIVGLLCRLFGKDIPIVASTFNLGQIYGGYKGRVARWALKDVKAFVVHSRREIQVYSEWLGIPVSRFYFVPLQRPVREIEIMEDVDQPFILAMGSAHRDYKLFFSVVAELGYPVVVIAGLHAIKDLVVPTNVTILSNLSISECHHFVQRARVNVVPIDNAMTASGQVTLIEAMMYGKAVVTTDTVGTVDYVIDGVTAKLIQPGSKVDMLEAITILWNDKNSRDDMGLCARKYVIENLSDSAAGNSMRKILDLIEKS
jgi:glycosyltransferase involved in cell wall biosynthesis